MAPRTMPVINIAILSLTALIALIAPIPGRAAGPRGADIGARRAIQAIYDSQDRAAAHKDLGGVFAQTAPGFLAIDQNGQKISLAQAKRNISELFSEASSVASSTAIEKLRLLGDTAIVTARSRDVVVFSDSAGEPGKLVIDDLSVDTWVKTGKGWLQTRSHDISQTVHREMSPAPEAYDPMLS